MIIAGHVFKIHQAVEKALKAFLWGLGRPRPGHSLTYLLKYIFEILSENLLTIMCVVFLINSTIYLLGILMHGLKVFLNNILLEEKLKKL